MFYPLDKLPVEKDTQKLVYISELLIYRVGHIQQSLVFEMETNFINALLDVCTTFTTEVESIVPQSQSDDFCNCIFGLQKQ